VRASYMASLLLIAAAISAALLILAFLAGKLFESKVVRRRIMIGTAVTYLIGGIGYFGFIAFVMSSCLNC
jgi:hypothetical protein